jgi:hypothetical protein
LSLAGDTGATSIPRAEDERLLKKWKESDLWPRIAEQASSVFKANDRLSFISNFCPEVTYDRFGVFCAGLSMYTDGIDKEAAHRHLQKEGAGEDDPRWRWQHVEPLHYTGCSLYAVLSRKAEEAKAAKEPIGPWWREHLAEIIVGVVVAAATAIITKALS